MKRIAIGLIIAAALLAQVGTLAPQGDGTLQWHTGSSAITVSRTRASEAIHKPFHSGKVTTGKYSAMLVLEDADSAPGFALAVTASGSDYVIAEVFYWRTARVGAKDMRLLLHKTQVVHMFGDAMSMSDPFDVPLKEVEKINIIRVEETGKSEFWNNEGNGKAE